MPNAYRVYAIVRPDAQLPAAAELAMVSWCQLAAVAGRTEESGAPPTVEAMLRHAAVVEAICQRGPALPVRFGTVFHDETSIASALAERYQMLDADLDRLGGKVELSLTALWAAPTLGEAAAPSARPFSGRSAGASYLHACAARLRHDEGLKDRARTVRRMLDEVLGTRALEQRVSVVPSPRVVVRTAYLLNPASIDTFRAAFEAIRQDRREVRLLLTGPWPPYSFVRRAETESGAAPSGRLETLAQMLSDAMRETRPSGRGALVNN